VPTTVVLSACDGGRSAVRAGEEVMGLVASLLALGASSVITSVLPVPDAETVPLMVRLHQGMIDGGAPARALADACASVTPRAVPVTSAEGRARVVSASFACFGA